MSYQPGTSSSETVQLARSASRLKVVFDPPASQWDAFVSVHPQGHFFQSSTWMGFKARHGWSALRVGITRAGELVAGGGLLVRALPLGQHTAYLPRGPVCDFADEQVAWMLRNALDRAARARRAIALTYEPYQVSSDRLLAQLTWLGLQPTRPVQPRSTIVVDLTAAPDEMTRRQKPKKRYNARLAVRRGVTIAQAETVAEAQAWSALCMITAVRDHFTPYSAAYYVDAWQNLRAAERGALFLAYHEGRLLAGILVAHLGDEAIYLYGASGNEGRQLMPNDLLQWEAMLWARLHGARRYDMFGIPDTDAPDEPLRGVARFKEGWGGDVVRYAGTFDRVYRPWRYRLHTQAVPVARQLPTRMRGTALHVLSWRPRTALLAEQKDETAAMREE